MQPITAKFRKVNIRIPFRPNIKISKENSFSDGDYASAAKNRVALELKRFMTAYPGAVDSPLGIMIAGISQ